MPDYPTLTDEYKRQATAGTALPRERYAVGIRTQDGERDFEWIGVQVVGVGPRLVALDPELDPRKGLRADGLRGVSLANFLNHAVGLARPGLPTGPGTGRWIPVRTPGGVARELDTRIELERQALVLAHDYRPANPERDASRVKAAVAEFVLLWLQTGWVLSGRVFNFEPEKSRAGETRFLSVQAPKAYGSAARLGWGRGLPFLALNRKFLVAYKRAVAREELERFLQTAPDEQPEGFTPA